MKKKKLNDLFEKNSIEIIDGVIYQVYGIKVIVIINRQ